MSNLKLMFLAMMVAFLTACGGGGGSAGTTPGTGTGTGTGTGNGSGGTQTVVISTPTLAIQLVDSAGAVTTTVGGIAPVFAKATLRNGAGVAVSGQVVTFLSGNGLVRFSPISGTALTDADGIASVQVLPALDTSAGAGTINANATVGTVSALGAVSFVVPVNSATPPSPIVGPVPTTVEIFSSSAQLSSAPNSSISFTVVVKDANNQAIPDRTVTFSATSGNLSGGLPAPKTGAAGQAITSVSLTPGTDQSNRNIVVTATAGSINQSVTIAVQGTTLSLAGDAAVLAGASTTFTAKALDSAGRAISGVTLSVVSSLGNTVTPRSLVTDSQGAVSFVYAGTRAGADSLTLTGLGTSARAAISVSNDDFRFETPAANTSIAVGNTLTVSVRYLSGGVPSVGTPVTFSTTRGSVSLDTALTDGNGRASTVIKSSTSGPAGVIAQVASAQTTLPVVFVATTPASLVLQANPAAVPPNSGGTSLNQSAVQAIVRDATGNPVTGRVVNFTAVSDLSNGTLSPGSGVTDANGSVAVQFIPGALTTAANGVVVRATVQGTNVGSTTALTVSGQALFISIATGNVISNLNETTYQKQFSVYVTDANGAPAANRVVNLSALPLNYRKGSLEFKRGLPTGWDYKGSPTECPNEDVNRNGILDAGDDKNNNGRLDPGLPVVVSPAAVLTEANGFATFNLQYGENFALWLDARITARANVGGTESSQVTDYFLAASAADLNSETTPANSVSPFGRATDCTDPN